MFRISPSARCRANAQVSQKGAPSEPAYASRFMFHVSCFTLHAGTAYRRFFLRNTSSQTVLSSPQVRMLGKSAGHREDPRQQVAGALPCRLPPGHSKSHPVGPACLTHKCPRGQIMSNRCGPHTLRLGRVPTCARVWQLLFSAGCRHRVLSHCSCPADPRTPSPARARALELWRSGLAHDLSDGSPVGHARDSSEM